MIDAEHLCPGCMQLRDHMDGPCPVCGYPDKQLTIKGSLPVFSILAGRYLLGCPLGKGGFGITYIAMDLPTEQIVAIKEFFPADLAVRDSDEEQVFPINEEKALYFRTGMRSFSEEGRLLSLCASIPGIVPFREILQANGTAYLVMDYIPGLSMRKYMKLQGGPFHRRAGAGADEANPDGAGRHASEKHHPPGYQPGEPDPRPGSEAYSY